MNEPDAYALEEACACAEAHGGEVVVCSAGPPACSRSSAKALAAAPIGRFTWRTTAGCGRRVVAAARLAAAMKEEQFDLVLTGLQSDDQGHGQTGVMLAERLGIPHSTIIMEVRSRTARCGSSASCEGGWFQWIAMPLPALLTIQSGINQLRYATLEGDHAAKKKEIRKVSLPAGLQATQQIVGLAVPTRTKQTQRIDGARRRRPPRSSSAACARRREPMILVDRGTARWCAQRGLRGRRLRPPALAKTAGGCP
jgi:electron transfer flavoprotein beta subunit